MTIWRLVSNEIAHRRLNFALGALAVAVATGVIVTAVMVLRAHDAATEGQLGRMQAEADQRLDAMEDDYRQYMKELGFNLLIIPAKQDLTEFWTRGYATHTMPEQNVQTLANSRSTTIRHLLPIVQKQVLWPEHQRSIILIGTRGEIPLAHRLPKEPMLLAVPPGQAVVGDRLARDLQLKAGQTVEFMGRSFEVAKVQPERGTAEDATIWIDLATAQELLGMDGQINAIEALKCLCAEIGPEELRREVAGILPDATVILRQNKVTVRAKARLRAQAEHEQAMESEKIHRLTLRRTRENVAALLVPAMIVAAVLSIGLLAFGNVKQRAVEIGILRTLGVKSPRIFILFLSRAALLGLLGAVLGCMAGLGAGIVLAGMLEQTLQLSQSLAFAPAVLMAGLMVAAPLLSAAASWVPALMASRQNPADILTAP